jgi:uncharacterized tellurite resistance protein B-like protein
MLRTLKNLVDRLDRLQSEAARSPPAPAADPEHVRLAAAVLLVEVMRADAQFGVDEQQVVLGSLRGLFQLDADEAEQLTELARSTALASTDLYTFTSRINERFSMEDRIRIVEAMWRVAHADGTLAAHERHVVWRIADLLYVPQGALHLARARALGGAG